MTTAVERNKNDATPKPKRDRLRESGLLNKIATPKVYGGWELSWHELFRISREFAKVDSAIAHVFFYHLGLTIPHLFGSVDR